MVLVVVRPSFFTFTDNRAQQNNARFQQHNMWQQMYGQPASMQPESPVLGFQVRRAHLLKDAMDIARKLIRNGNGTADLKKPLKIKFHNEAGRSFASRTLFGWRHGIDTWLFVACFFAVCVVWLLVLARCRCGGGDERIFSIVDRRIVCQRNRYMQHLAAH